MILRQFPHTDPVAISYLFGCGGHAACAVVDPLGDIRPYLRVAEETGMRIRFVVDTHVHADHRSAGRALASAAGAEYVLHAGADVASSMPRRTATGSRSGMSWWMCCTHPARPPSMCAFS
jgi:glyoxylase-like metal-dependent hydrolase (beta-lactamase superfamily II)